MKEDLEQSTVAAAIVPPLPALLYCTAVGLEFRRNRMPQWRLDGGIYHVVWRLHRRGDTLSLAERTLVADAIRLFQNERYQLAILCVMDDHVHILLQTKTGFDLSDILKAMKGGSAYAINDLRGSNGRLWQQSSHTQLLPGRPAIEACKNYIYNNPFTKWGIQSHEYQWLECFE